MLENDEQMNMEPEQEQGSEQKQGQEVCMNTNELHFIFHLLLFYCLLF